MTKGKWMKESKTRVKMVTRKNVTILCRSSLRRAHEGGLLSNSLIFNTLFTLLCGGTKARRAMTNFNKTEEIYCVSSTRVKE